MSKNFLLIRGIDMYSNEIDTLLKKRNFIIDSKTYLYICMTSNQLHNIKYSPYGNYFEVWSEDNFYWKFTVYKV